MADRQWLIIVKPQRLPTVSAGEYGSFVVGRPRRLPKAQTGESSGDPAGATQQ
jgi:hypothetical protein